MKPIELDRLSKQKLVALLKAYSRNWQTLDGLWFSGVETEFGLDAAVRIDLRNWERQATLEAKRLKKAMALGGGLESVLQLLSLMSWQLMSEPFEITEESPEKVAFGWKACAVQNSREKNGKPVFPCKNMKTTLLTSIAAVVEPQAEVKCIHCPPDARQAGFWCRWELTLKRANSQATSS